MADCFRGKPQDRYQYCRTTFHPDWSGFPQRKKLCGYLPMT